MQLPKVGRRGSEIHLKTSDPRQRVLKILILQEKCPRGGRNEPKAP